MPFAHKITVKTYEDAAWPGCDVVLVEESGYLDLFISADDCSHYETHRVKSVAEADALAQAFYDHLENQSCSECGGCICGQENCLAFGLPKCSCIGAVFHHRVPRTNRTTLAHTIAPWEETFSRGHDGCIGIYNSPEPRDRSGEPRVVQCIARVAIGPDDAANARRIVAAVNACEGIPTEALEKNSVREVLRLCKLALADAEAAIADIDQADYNLRSIVLCLSEAMAKAGGT